jgi:hypothetical protein
MTPSVLNKLLIELRENDAVNAIVGNRVRTPKPAPGDAAWADLVDGTRQYKFAFIVLGLLAAPRRLRLPVQDARIVVGCYGRNVIEAAELRWAASNAIHNIGPRIHANGLGIYNSWEDAGGEADSDPDTGQPLERFIVAAIATTQAVTA